MIIKKFRNSVVLSFVIMCLLLSVSGCSTRENGETYQPPIEENIGVPEKEQTTEEQSNTENTTDNSVNDETTNPENLRMNLLVYVNNEYPADKVVVSVKPTEALYLGYGAGGYVPANQTEWENAINAVTARVQSKDQVDPWETFEPIYVSWTHGEYEDVWQLCNDGSLWGWHDYEAPLRTDNYIAPEDAVELVELLKKAYAELALNPILPDQIRQIASAELVIDNKSYYLDDTEKLLSLEGYLSQTERVRDSSCLWSILRLTTNGGEVIEIALARDGCNIWHSDGMYYRFGIETNEIYQMFGVDLEI